MSKKPKKKTKCSLCKGKGRIYSKIVPGVYVPCPCLGKTS